MAKNNSSFSVQNPSALTDVIDAAEYAASESVLRKAAAAGATVFKNEIALRAPRVSGQFANGISVAFVPEDSVTGVTATYMVAFVGDVKRKAGDTRRPISRIALARFFEGGTSRMAARPFIRPAYEAKKGEAGNVTINKIQEAVKSGG